MAALVNLLERKGVLTPGEVVEEIKRLRGGGATEAAGAMPDCATELHGLLAQGPPSWARSPRPAGLGSGAPCLGDHRAQAEIPCLGA